MPDPDREPADRDGGLDAPTQRRVVRERYARIATGADGAGGQRASSDSCCESGAGRASPVDGLAEKMGYSTDEIETVEVDANLGLGCGNPRALASISPGETVLDLGSGAGFDCFLAAEEVGETGRVIGVDMAPEMVDKARENARASGTETVEFRLGEIEHLPVADGTVDVIVSNCVVNLSPDKPQVFREAYRVLRPGGRLAISDVVLTAELPDAIRADADAVASCVAGAATMEELERMLAATAFEDIEVVPADDSDRLVRQWDDDRDLSAFIASASIRARKPMAADQGEK